MVKSIGGCQASARTSARQAIVPRGVPNEGCPSSPALLGRRRHGCWSKLVLGGSLRAIPVSARVQARHSCARSEAHDRQGRGPRNTCAPGDAAARPGSTLASLSRMSLSLFPHALCVPLTSPSSAQEGPTHSDRGGPHVRAGHKRALCGVERQGTMQAKTGERETGLRQHPPAEATR